MSNWGISLSTPSWRQNGRIVIGLQRPVERAVLAHAIVTLGLEVNFLRRGVGRLSLEHASGRPGVLVFDAAWNTRLEEVCRQSLAAGLAPLGVLDVADDRAAELLGSELADFVRRPFSPTDVLVRAIRCLRNATLSANASLRLDATRYEVHCYGSAVRLRRAEFKVLAYLIERAPRAVPKREIVERVLGAAGDGSSARNQIFELRQKLAAIGLGCALETVHGRGSYRWGGPNLGPGCRPQHAGQFP